jgi:hypothetical protein
MTPLIIQQIFAMQPLPENLPKPLKTALEGILWLAWLSFSGGTLLLILLFLTEGDNFHIYVWGFLYVVCAAIANSIAVGAMVVTAAINPEYKRLIMQRTSILLLNIPVTVLYLVIVFGGYFDFKQ